MKSFTLKAMVAGMGLVTGLALAQPSLAADATKGATVFKKCVACHAMEAGKNKVGPSLAKIIGRKAATVEGFSYSDAMKKSGLTWDDDTLAKYLANPKALVPGTKMSFVGLPKPEDVQDLLAYLKANGG